jgi:Permease MlaE
LIRQLRTIGAESSFVVGLIGLFTGMELGLQGYNALRRFGSAPKRQASFGCCRPGRQQLQVTRRIPRRFWRGGVLSLTGLAIIVGTIVLVQHVSLKPPHTQASIPPV